MELNVKGTPDEIKAFLSDQEEDYGEYFCVDLDDEEDEDCEGYRDFLDEDIVAELEEEEEEFDFLSKDNTDALLAALDEFSPDELQTINAFLDILLDLVNRQEEFEDSKALVVTPKGPRYIWTISEIADELGHFPVPRKHDLWGTKCVLYCEGKDLIRTADRLYLVGTAAIAGQKDMTEDERDQLIALLRENTFVLDLGGKQIPAVSVW